MRAKRPRPVERSVDARAQDRAAARTRSERDSLHDQRQLRLAPDNEGRSLAGSHAAEGELPAIVPITVAAEDAGRGNGRWARARVGDLDGPRAHALGAARYDDRGAEGRRTDCSKSNRPRTWRCSCGGHADRRPSDSRVAVASASKPSRRASSSRTSGSSTTRRVARRRGGGAYVRARAFTLANVVFEDNFSRGDGGGLHIHSPPGAEATRATTLQLIANEAGANGEVFDGRHRLEAVATSLTAHGNTALSVAVCVSTRTPFSGLRRTSR